MKLSSVVLGLVGMAAMLLTGCSTAPQSPEERANLHDDAQASLQRMERDDPGLRNFLDNAYGYVMFPSVGKGGLGVGGAFGKGEVFEKGQHIGFASLTQASIGLQAGGQEYAELLVFENQAALDKFKGNKFEVSANASAVALKAGAAAAAKFSNGVAIFIHTKGGLMAEASVGGQRFEFVSKDTQRDIERERGTRNDADTNRTSESRTTVEEKRTTTDNGPTRVEGRIDTK